jgi:TRAP-type mannitol/chloroaromatic compound transport system permease large subunit
MEWWLIISLLFGGMVFLLLTNLPIAFAFLVVNLIAAYYFLGGLPGLVGVVTGAFTSITTFTLLPVPFFILMGELIFHSGLGLNAVNVLDKWLGNLRGRLSLLAIIMGVIIGALSGSTIATCALLGTILLPQMLEKGYSKNMSLGPLMGVGTVDALIPPNALTVVLATTCAYAQSDTALQPNPPAHAVLELGDALGPERLLLAILSRCGGMALTRRYAGWLYAYFSRSHGSCEKH